MGTLTRAAAIVPSAWGCLLPSLSIDGRMLRSLACLAFAAVALAAPRAEGPVTPFLGKPVLESQQLFPGERFPNVVVAKDGTVLAAWNPVQVRRSVDGGKTWGPSVAVGPGLMGGGFIVDEVSGDILGFVEDRHPPAPLKVYRSKDSGLTWMADPVVIHPNSQGHVPAMHMNEAGITLRHGEHRWRLIRATRWYARQNYPASYWFTHYTNAMFSDDGGRSWQASEPFPARGTGEAGIVELSDGTLLYNTRRHWAPERDEALWRWFAVSRDGGRTWSDLARSTVLPDGETSTPYGLMGGFVRLPVEKRDILLFSNIVSDKGRRNGHVWASFDGGKTWPLRRQVFAGAFAYSSLAAGRPGTPSEGWIYLLYEGGPSGGGTFARFNLSWVLGGEPTGDGTVPDWVRPR